MSVPEVIYRLKNNLQGFFDQIGAGETGFSGEEIECPDGLFRESLELPALEEYIKEADMVCDYCFRLLSLKRCNVGLKIDYHKDYRNGLTAPRGVYCRKIDYRDSKNIGDIKYIWELNRHLFLTVLVIAYRVTGQKKYFDHFNLFLEEWIRQNPFMIGVNWLSPLELSIRLINWTICIHLLGETLEERVRENLKKAIYQHCWYISRNFSLYSSANNHLIGEAAGLFIASTALPKFKESNRWQKRAYKILIREAVKQNHPDGVNKEQSTSYQQFVFDLLLLAGLVGNRYQVEFPDEYWSTLEAMCEFAASLENVAGLIPQIGDDDDGYVIDAGQRIFGPYRSILNTASYIFDRKDFPLRNWREDLKTSLLTGIDGVAPGAFNTGSGKSLREAFKKGGYYTLTCNRGSDREQKLIFDCGPLGYLSIAAHGHADALSFCFSAGGFQIFIDPGTYTYHTDEKWRIYFRGTRAHNTACLDSADQSVIKGNFMWGKKAETKILEYRAGSHVKGMHNGYMRFGSNGVTHQRAISYRQKEDEWIILDEFEGSGSHFVEICFHLDRSCFVESRSKSSVKIRFPGGICHLGFEPGSTFNIYYGDEQQPLGWQSTSYGIRHPTNTIVLSKEIYGHSTIRTTFAVKFKPAFLNVQS